MREEIVQPLFLSGKATKWIWQLIKDFRVDGEGGSAIGYGPVANRERIDRWGARWGSDEGQWDITLCIPFITVCSQKVCDSFSYDAGCDSFKYFILRAEGPGIRKWPDKTSIFMRQESIVWVVFHVCGWPEPILDQSGRDGRSGFGPRKTDHESRSSMEPRRTRNVHLGWE